MKKLDAHIFSLVEDPEITFRELTDIVNAICLNRIKINICYSYSTICFSHYLTFSKKKLTTSGSVWFTALNLIVTLIALPSILLSTNTSINSALGS